MAKKLIRNMDIVDEKYDDRLLPYFENKTRKEIMLHMVINSLPRSKSRKLSSYFHLDRDIDGYNDILDIHLSSDLIEKVPSKDLKYIEITYFEEYNSLLLEYLLYDIEYIKEEVIESSVIITLKHYHVKDQILHQLNERKKQYFVENRVKTRSMKIREWTQYQVPYSFTEPKISELNSYRNIKPCYYKDDKDNNYGVIIEDKSNGMTNSIYLKMYCRNDRDAWLSHIDYVLYKLRLYREEEEEKQIELESIHNTEDEEDHAAGHGLWYYNENHHKKISIDSEEQKSDVNDWDQKPASIPIIDSSYYEEDFHHDAPDGSLVNHPEMDPCMKQKLMNDFEVIGDDDDEISNDDETKEEYVPNYHFGSYLEYWRDHYDNSVIPKYGTLKEEFLNNKIYQITEEKYYILYEECIDKWEMKGFMIKARKIGPNNDKFNVKPGSSMSINHIMSLKFYTDFTEGQKKFCEACRKRNENESEEELIRRNSEIANWCRYMREATTFFGNKMEEKFVYTGLKKKLVLSSLTQTFYCPLSTSKSPNVAGNFSQEGGVY